MLLLRTKLLNSFPLSSLGWHALPGAEKIIHGPRNCVDYHWLDGDFAVMKIDLRNAGV